MPEGDTPILRLNPALDPAPFAAAYARDGVVQVPALFDPEVADDIAAVLERGTPWSLVHSDEAGREQILDAADGLLFNEPESLDRRDAALDLLDDLVEFGRWEPSAANAVAQAIRACGPVAMPR